MADNQMRPTVRRRVHKTRLVGCFTVLLVFIIIFSALISSCRKNQDKKTNVKPASKQNVVTTNPAVTEPVKKEKYLICIDPGHGGSDPGSGEVRIEKVDNLTYAMEVYNELNKRDGIEAMITRTSDVDLFTEERAEMANKAGADLYLALHRNYIEDSSVCGVEIWIQDAHVVADDVLGYKLRTKLSKVGISKDRGTQTGFTNAKQKNFQIIEFTDMTSCIVELGFISNDEDNRLFDEKYKEYAVAIADAAEEMCIEGYLDNQKKKNQN